MAEKAHITATPIGSPSGTPWVLIRPCEIAPFTTRYLTEELMAASHMSTNGAGVPKWMRRLREITHRLTAKHVETPFEVQHESVNCVPSMVV